MSRDARGFSLVEALVAVALTMTVIGGVFALVTPAQGTVRSQAETADEHQRLRVAVEAITHDLAMAGAGFDVGPLAGPLVHWIAPILPGRFGRPPEPGTVSVLYIPPGAPQGTLLDDLTGPDVFVRVDRPGTCPAGDATCGFRTGMPVLLLDDSGRAALAAIAEVRGATVRLEPRDVPFSGAHGAGTAMAQVVARSYVFDAPARRLTRLDGPRASFPLLDEVVRFDVEYLADLEPPVLRKPVTDLEGPWTTYGPRPPPIGVRGPGADYADGENCAFRVQAGVQVSRLDETPLQGPAGLAPLTLSALGDGPWCPGSSSAGRFDADLLRVRGVRLHVRVQAQPDALRGTNPPGQLLFVNPGTSRDARAYVPDREVRIDVTPRNLNPGR